MSELKIPILFYNVSLYFGENCLENLYFGFNERNVETEQDIEWLLNHLWFYRTIV